MGNKKTNTKKKTTKVVLKGRGAYNAERFQVGKRATTQGRKIFEVGGHAIGNAVGGPLGGWLGQGLGSLASYLTGCGNYKLKRNSMKKSYDGLDEVPYMHSNNESITIRHREFLTDVVTSSSANTFNIMESFALNPGLAATFPWLSQVAQNFQEWEPLGIAFEFKSMSADAIASSTNTALGSLQLSTQYRASQTLPTTKLLVLQEDYASDCKASRDMVHLVECDPKQNIFSRRYVRNTAVPAGEIQEEFDLGTTSISTSGFQGTSVNAGELWITYEIRLSKPIFQQGVLNSSTGYAHYANPSGAASATLFGTGTRVQKLDNIGVTVSNTVITFPNTVQPGSVFQVQMYWAGATAATSFSSAFGTGLAATGSILQGNGSEGEGTMTATGTNACITQFIAVIQNAIPSNTFTYTPTLTLTGATTVDIVIVEIPSNAV